MKVGDQRVSRHRVRNRHLRQSTGALSQVGTGTAWRFVAFRTHLCGGPGEGCDRWGADAAAGARMRPQRLGNEAFAGARLRERPMARSRRRATFGVSGMRR